MYEVDKRKDCFSVTIHCGTDWTKPNGISQYISWLESENKRLKALKMDDQKRMKWHQRRVEWSSALQAMVGEQYV